MLRGIGPAPGYPACPDHRINRQMFEVLEADETGMDDAEARRALATVV
jgi:5-methyltetrahydrofolate--homocysteine methyltransferase